MRRLTLQLVVAVVASAAFVVTAVTGLVLYTPGRLLPSVGGSLPGWRTVHLWSALVLALAVATHVVVNRRSVGRPVAGLFRPGPAPARSNGAEAAADPRAGATDARPGAAPAGDTDAAAPGAGHDSRMRLTRRRLLWLAAGAAAAAAAAFGFERHEQRARGAAAGVLADFPVLNIESGPPATTAAAWEVVVDGLVAAPLKLDRTAWLALPRTQETRTFHCVEGWSVDHLGWEGVRVADLLSAAAPQAGAGFVTFHAHDGAYTDTLTLDEARAPETLLADRLDGAPLPPDHGGPLRLVVPSQLGYKSVKWVVRVELTAERAQGYWEGRGYPAEAPVG
jgi:DMSO/TMAO reductase YedYZ molybdopterin-dependent catalytic subunit